MINERLKKREAGDISDSADLLDLLLAEMYEEKNLKEKDRQRIIEEVIAHCKIFFFGGYETSSNVLTWTLITLSVYQDWQTRARQEVIQVFGDKKEITQDDASKLKLVSLNFLCIIFVNCMYFYFLNPVSNFILLLSILVLLMSTLIIFCVQFYSCYFCHFGLQKDQNRHPEDQN